MAVKPLLLHAIWTTTSAALTLPKDISSIIPACASGCFQSFVEVNFPNVCGPQPLLQCLCTRTGSTGYTIGEGAVSCMVVENDVGSCDAASANSTAVSRAYGMCNGQINAAPQTHETIVATMVVPTGGGPVVVPTQVPTTLETAPKPPSVTPVTQSRPPFSTSSASVIPQPAAAPTGSSNQQNLNAAQIAGISLGAAAAVLLAITALVLIRLCRRKRREEQPSPVFAKMRDSWSFGGKRSEWSPHMLQISNPVHHERPDMDFTRALDNRGSVRPDTIGLAICPDGTAVAVASSQSRAQRASALGQQQPPQPPPKPMLTLSIPPDELAPPRAISQAFPFGGRDSVMTEFAEDGEDVASGTGSAQIWRPPPTDPVSAATYYVADKWGNWVLSNPHRRSQAAELEGSSPLTRSQAEKHSISQATKAAALPSAASSLPVKPEAAKLGPPIQFKQSTGLTRSSSFYSNYSLPTSAVPGPSNPMPRPLATRESYQKMMRENSAKRLNRKSSKGLDRSDSNMSQHSATTIASSTADGEYDIIDPEQPNLSPVVESPHSVGVSPVTYPHISSRIDKLKLFPPPVRGDLHHPPGQPSPTLGHLVPLTQVPVAPQRRQMNANPNPSPNYNPAQVRTGSPNPQFFQQRQPASRIASPESRQQQPQTRLASPESRFQQPPARIVSPESRLQQAPARLASPESRFQQPIARLTSPGLQVEQELRPSTPNSHTSASSSLLDRRVGTSRVAALTLSGPNSGPRGRDWKRQSGNRTPGLMVPGSGGVPIALASPMWQPKLTPTRRGDDLVLAVQRQ